MSAYIFFTQIPDVVWSGIIASLLTLCGVLLSDWRNTNRLKLQLQHDSDEKAKQRKADLRKDVYLRAAEELVKANIYLASLPNVDLTKVNASQGLEGIFAAAAKLQMVSEVSTSKCVGELVGIYSELLLWVLARIQPIQYLQIEIGIRDNFYNKAESEVARVLAAMTQANESANLDGEAFKALQRSFEIQQGFADKIAKERNELWQQRIALHLAFAKEFTAKMKLIGESSTLAMVEIRRELEIDGNIDEFTAYLNEQWHRLSIQLDKFLESLECAKN